MNGNFPTDISKSQKKKKGMKNIPACDLTFNVN